MVCNVLEYLEDAQKKYPDKIVFGDEKRQFTYKEFSEITRNIGGHLAKRDICLKPVVVLIDKDVESIAAFMGIVYGGGFYVPVDKNLPIERIRLILSVVEPEYLILKKEEKELAGEIGKESELLFFEELAGEKMDEEEREMLLGSVRCTHLDTNPLYMIFTSGSTGVPKGVLISHRSVIDMAEQFTRVFHFSKEEVFASQAPFDFDVSVKDIYLTLKNQATMYIVPKSMFVLPKRLSRYLNEKKATAIIWAASALGVVASFKAFEKEAPRYLKYIMFSGEVLPVKVLHYWQAHKKDATYVNLYGPTEITCNCTYYIVDRDFLTHEVLPIGKAFPNTQILLLNQENKPVKSGETGEICVRGSSLALGYYKNKEATRKAFCQSPLHDDYEDMIYRTGDMGYVNERGELVFAARRDHQIKHMGHRIELLEVEAAAYSVEEVEKCCCIYDKAREKLLFIYQAKEPMEEKLIRSLQKKLPKYMCPNLFFRVDKIPENSHGKVDRYRLKQEYTEKKQ